MVFGGGRRGGVGGDGSHRLSAVNPEVEEWYAVKRGVVLVYKLDDEGGVSVQN
jgi:hypothetical protein